MAEVLGREVTIKDSVGTLICEGITSKGFEVSNEGIDITSDDSSGWQTFMSQPGQKAISMSIEGVFTDSTLKTQALSATDIKLEDVQVYDGTTTLTGDFVITAYSNSGDMADAVRFSATLQSSGEVA